MGCSDSVPKNPEEEEYERKRRKKRRKKKRKKKKGKKKRRKHRAYEPQPDDVYITEQMQEQMGQQLPPLDGPDTQRRSQAESFDQISLKDPYVPPPEPEQPVRSGVPDPARDDKPDPPCDDKPDPPCDDQPNDDRDQPEQGYGDEPERPPYNGPMPGSICYHEPTGEYRYYHDGKLLGVVDREEAERLSKKWPRCRGDPYAPNRSFQQGDDYQKPAPDYQKPQPDPTYREPSRPSAQQGYSQNQYSTNKETYNQNQYSTTNKDTYNQNQYSTTNKETYNQNQYSTTNKETYNPDVGYPTPAQAVAARGAVY